MGTLVWSKLRSVVHPMGSVRVTAATGEELMLRSRLAVRFVLYVVVAIVATGCNLDDFLNALAQYSDEVACQFQGQLCRDLSDECLVPDTCDASLDCVDNGSQPQGTPCSDSDNPCVTGGACDGNGGCVLEYAEPGTPCGNLGNDCIVSGTCDASGTCVPVFKEAGASCGDPTGSGCLNPDVCDGEGTCLANDEPTTDSDGDGVPDCGDQCPNNPDVFVASADDATCDGIDQDCSGEADEDFVGTEVTCGVGACENTGTTACVDGEAIEECQPLPAGEEIAGDNIDNDCDGHIDEVGECAELDSNCDGVDDDCDGVADDDFEMYYSACGVGRCIAIGQVQCVNGQLDDSCVPRPPAANDATCDGMDDNCDGTADEGYIPLTTHCGVGACASTGVTSCVGAQVYDSCQAGQPIGVDSNCNGIDEDCNGSIDDLYVPTATQCGVGECAAEGQLLCVQGGTQNTCQAATPEDEICNGLDDNCDGTVDNGGNALCDDADGCTTDVCNGLAGCGHTNVPVDCEGSWGEWGTCQQEGTTCSGEQSRTFTITTPASCGGQACDYENGASGSQACTSVASGTECDDDNACTTNDICNGSGTCSGTNVPVNCEGSWGEWGTCQQDGTTCSGEQSRTFTITTPASCGGQACDYENGATGDHRTCNVDADTECDDGNDCTDTDVCDGSGSCEGVYACDGVPVLNEIDYDQPGTDGAEFVEIFNPDTSSVDLSKYDLELVDGSTGSVYKTVELDSGLDTNLLGIGEYLVVGADSVLLGLDSGVFSISLGTTSVQDGTPDGARLVLRSNGTFVDGIAYEDEMSGTGEGDFAVDDTDVESSSLGRCPNGADSDDNWTDFDLLDTPTPGATNDCDNPLPVDCLFTDWSDWSECSATCGGGTQTRTRLVLVYPKDGGDACPALSDSQSCNTQECTGACCNASDECVLTTQTSCVAGSGTWDGSASCNGVACGYSPMGACCLFIYGNPFCMDRSSIDCDFLWQTYEYTFGAYFPGVDCMDAPCPGY